MNDDELDRLVAGLSPVRDQQVATLDLRDAEDDLLEDIMATTTTRVRLQGTPQPTGRRRLRVALAIGAVAAAVLAVAAVTLRDNDVVTAPANETPVGSGVQPLLALPIPEGYEIQSATEHETLAGGANYTITYSQTAPDTTRDFFAFTVQTVEDVDGKMWEPKEGREGELEVRGHEAVRDERVGVTSVSWQETDGVVVTVSFGSDAPDGAFEAFVEGLRPATAAEWQVILDGQAADSAVGSTTSLPSDTPPPPLATNPLAALPAPEGYELSPSSATPIVNGVTAYAIDYLVTGPDNLDLNFSGFTVQTYADVDGTAWAALSAGRLDEDYEVRGHPAVAEGAAGTQYVSWQESDGVTVTVSFASDAPDGAFDAFVAGLRPVTAQEWSEIRAATGG